MLILASDGLQDLCYNFLQMAISTLFWIELANDF